MQEFEAQGLGIQGLRVGLSLSDASRRGICRKAVIIQCVADLGLMEGLVFRARVQGMRAS